MSKIDACVVLEETFRGVVARHINITTPGILSIRGSHEIPAIALGAVRNERWPFMIGSRGWRRAPIPP